MPVLCRDSSLFSFVEYQLRLNLKSSTVQIFSIEELSQPHLTIQYEKKSKNMLQLDSWIDCSLLNSPNSEEEIASQGFQFHSASNGYKFPVGEIRFNETGKIKRRFMFCKIAVGHAFCVSEEYAKIGIVPEGYDSFCIAQNEGTIDKVDIDKELNMNNRHNHYEYVIKEASQILPMYIVEFEFNEEEEKKSRLKVICDNCEAAPATTFCQADTANLCATCDKAMHTSKLASRHQRIPLDKGPQSFSKCYNHPDKHVEFYCPTCNIPVCVHCKMVGHHSNGDASKHKLVTVMEAFQSVVENSTTNDPIFESRNSKIEAQFHSIIDRAKSIERNSIEIQQQLEEIYKKALIDLKTITRRKINVLKGDILELERQRNEIHILEDFLLYEKTGTNAIQFILDWNHYLQVKEELHNFAYFKESIDVFPDIKISGAIQVCAEQSSFECLIQDGKIEFKPKAPPRIRGTTNQITSQSTMLNESAEAKGRVRKTTELFSETLKTMNSNQTSGFEI